MKRSVESETIRPVLSIFISKKTLCGRVNDGVRPTNSLKAFLVFFFYTETFPISYVFIDFLSMRPRDEGGFFRCGDTKAFPDEELLTQSAAMAADAGANSAPCSRALNE